MSTMQPSTNLWANSSWNLVKKSPFHHLENLFLLMWHLKISKMDSVSELKNQNVMSSKKSSKCSFRNVCMWKNSDIFYSNVEPSSQSRNKTNSMFHFFLLLLLMAFGKQCTRKLCSPFLKQRDSSRKSQNPKNQRQSFHCKSG